MFYYHFNEQLVRDSQREFVQAVLNGKFSANSERLLGYSQGRGITYFFKTTPELAVDSVLRHYYRGGFFGKIVKDRYFFKSLEKTRAYQEFNLLNQLVAWDIPVPRPIALRIERGVFSYRADILLEKIAATDLSKLLQQRKLTPYEYQEIGRLIYRLHQRQVHHSDLNIHNIMQDKQGKFWLIDFDKCYLQQGNHWKEENLSRLLRSFHKEQLRLGIQFSEEDWQHLRAGYSN